MIVPAIRVIQNEKDVFIFSLNAMFLLEITDCDNPRDVDKEEGIQRLFKKEKGMAIAKYIDNESPILPNNIIINLNLEKFKLTIDDVFINGFICFDKLIEQATKLEISQKEIAFIIDGQHRLRAFEYTKEKNFPLIISAVINRSLAEIAEIFVKINYFQTPVSKSRALDLISLGENVFPEFKNHHELTKKLNDNLESPFYNKIKMLGLGDGIISQASFIDSLIKYKIIHTLNELSIPPFENDNLYSVLWVYFDVIKVKYIDCWKNLDSNLTKAFGIRALFKVLNDLINKYSAENKEFSTKNLNDTFKNIDNDFWYSEPVSKLGGEKGVTILYKLILDKI